MGGLDSLFGILSGRDASFREQILAVVAEQKDRVLDQVVNLLNPIAWKQTDSNPQQQIPHIRSSYVAALGNELGLRGVEAALADYCRFQVSEAEKAAVKDTFAHLFDVDELINTIVEDINQQVFTFPLLSGLLSQV